MIKQGKAATGLPQHLKNTNLKLCKKLGACLKFGRALKPAADATPER